jgi:hypothetical protein
MRKGEMDGRGSTTSFSVSALDQLQQQGFKYVRVVGLTTDNHYDYTDPQCLLLVPLRELPSDPGQKDIYEPLQSDLLYGWANGDAGGVRIVIARQAS